MSLPKAISPADFAREYGWSERRVREKARELGACRIFGNRMMLLPQDVNAILEASKPCPSKSIDAVRSIITEERSAAKDFAVLQVLRPGKPRKGLRPRSKPRSANVVPMVPNPS
jgi:hypothetical protein